MRLARGGRSIHPLTRVRSPDLAPLPRAGDRGRWHTGVHGARNAAAAAVHGRRRLVDARRHGLRAHGRTATLQGQYRKGGCRQPGAAPYPLACVLRDRAASIATARPCSSCACSRRPRAQSTFNRILERDLEFPPSFSVEARSLVDMLLARDPRKRLGGGGGGAREVKLHPFFASVPWDRLSRKQVRAAD